MILDVHGIICTQSQVPNVELLQNRILKGLSERKCKVLIDKDGTIQFKGSWADLNPFRFRLWGTEGQIRCTEDVQGGVKITYYFSLIIARIVCIVWSLSTILLYLLGEFELFPLIFFNLVIWLWLYGGYYLMQKFWYKRFIKKLIHSID